MLARRLFLKNSAVAMFGLGAAPLWLSRAMYAQNQVAGKKKVLIAIFQRGAVDGLNMVVPHGDAGYYTARPSIAIPRPNGTESSVVDLDGFFGLHPALRGLKPLWNEKQLAIVDAVGSPDPTRSHFDAQDYMESGMPGAKFGTDGWLNRAMRPESAPSPVRAVSLSPDLPRTLRGRNEAVAIGSIGDFEIRDAPAASVFETMYSTSTDRVLNGTARETFEAVRIMQSLQKTPYVPAHNARYPKGRLGQSLSQIARLIKADVGLEVAFADVGGWDTHVNEVGAHPHEGQLADLLRGFSDALSAFSQDMGDRMAEVTLVTMSEFGRTVKENGDRGTDHGHANAMFILGGDVSGGRVYGSWPGLAHEQLYEGRDLNVTTDFRSVLAEIVGKQMHGPDASRVFPGFHASTSLNVLRQS